MVYEGIENFLNILWYNKISCNILFLHTWNFVFIIRSYVPISSFHVDKLESSNFDTCVNFDFQ